MTAPTHSAPPGITPPTTVPPACGFDVITALYFEEIRQALPLDDPDRHALEHPTTEAVFAALAADNPDRVTLKRGKPKGTLSRLKAHDLNHRLRQAIGAPYAEVRITPQQWHLRMVFCVMAIGYDRREIPLPAGAITIISDAVSAAFPTAQWDRAQNYYPLDGSLSEHTPQVPACLRGRAS